MAGRRAREGVPGWCRWRCGRPACGSSARTGSPLPSWPGAPGTGTNLGGMLRWGYITIESGRAGPNATPPRPGSVIRATAGGREAQRVWRPLTGAIEARWAERSGAGGIARLKESLRAVAARLDPALPDFLPILGHGLWSTPTATGQPRNPDPGQPRNPARFRRTCPRCSPGSFWDSRSGQARAATPGPATPGPQRPGRNARTGQAPTGRA
jgi:hypothetical protein